MPQRRDRIYLVADLTGQCAGKILFEQPGLRGYLAQSAAQGQRASSDATESFGGDDDFLNGSGIKNGSITQSICNESGQGYWMPGFGCLRAEGENRPSRPSHLIYFAQNQRDEVRDLGQQAGALASDPGAKQQSYLTYTSQRNENAPTSCYQVTTGALCAADWRGPSRQYVQADKLIVNPLCTDARGYGDSHVCSTMTGNHESRISDYTSIIAYGGERAETLDASYYKGPGARNGKEREFLAEKRQGRKYIVRRLSPTECARLQGLPDCWAVPVHKDDMTDEEVSFWEKVRKTHAELT